MMGGVFLEKDKTFPALTGIRAVAVYMVFCHHYVGNYNPGYPIISYLKELYAGVTIFFVLSGFLIYYRYSESCKLEKGFLFEYFRNRFARIVPVYAFVVVLTSVGSCLWFKWDLSSELRSIVLQITFVRGFFDHLKFIGVGQGWTLTVEECFYALFPLLLLFIRRRGFIVTLLGVYLAGAVLLGIGTWLVSGGFFSPPDFVLNYTFFGRASEFFFGMFLGKLVLKKAPGEGNSRFPLLTVLGASGLVAGIYVMSTFQATQLDYGNYYFSGIFVNNLILPVFVIMLFYGLIYEKSVLQAFLGSRVMVFLGKASYVFYLVHVGIIQHLIEYVLPPSLFPTDLVSFLIFIFFFFISTNMASIVIYLLIEEPSRRLIRRLNLKTILFWQPRAELTQ